MNDSIVLRVGDSVASCAGKPFTGIVVDITRDPDTESMIVRVRDENNHHYLVRPGWLRIVARQTSELKVKTYALRNGTHEQSRLSVNLSVWAERFLNDYTATYKITYTECIRHALVALSLADTNAAMSVRVEPPADASWVTFDRPSTITSRVRNWWNNRKGNTAS